MRRMHMTTHRIDSMHANGQILKKKVKIAKKKKKTISTHHNLFLMNTSSQKLQYIREEWVNCSAVTHLRARYPLPYLCRRMAALRIFWYRTLCSQPRTVFWILIQADRNLSALSFSKYATCPALKKIFVLPNWNMSGS